MSHPGIVSVAMVLLLVMGSGAQAHAKGLSFALSFTAESSSHVSVWKKSG